MLSRDNRYENTSDKAREIAIQEMMSQAAEIGGTAVISVDIDYETLQVGGDDMLIVSASGTAVRF